MASVRANPNSAYENNFASSFGFLEYAIKNPAKITPIPTPLPIMDIAANPAPTNFKPNKMISILYEIS